MSDSVQIIERDGKPEWAILPYDVYLRLAEEAEMLQDIRDYDSVKAAIEQGEEELVPSEVTFALLQGENQVKVWREFRGLSQRQLSASAGISTSYLSQIEKGKRTGTTDVLLAIARTLRVTLEDLVCRPEAAPG